MSNPRRQGVESKLPPAPQTLLQHTWDLCLEAGIAINKDDFVFLHRAMVDYLTNRGEAKKVMLKILKATVTEGDYTKQYYQAGHVGDEEKQLDYRGIVEFGGWIYRGKVAGHDAIDVWDKPDLEACEMCGGLFPKTYCLQTTKTWSNGREHLENMCNHCRVAHEELNIRDTASNKVCETCVIKTCQYHPAKQQITSSRPDISKPLQSRTIFDSGPPVGMERRLTSPQTRYSAI